MSTTRPSSVSKGGCVIGIDPGSRCTGWGVVREVSGVLSLVDCGVIRAQTATDGAFSSRLAHIYTRLTELLVRFQPEEAAIEQVFTSVNIRSAIKLGQARGVAVAACAAHGLPVSDYEPRLVKKSLVGVGSAEKEQVRFMVGRILHAARADWPLDASDAIALAVCHLNMRRFARLGI